MKEEFLYSGALATISAQSAGNGRYFWAYKIHPVRKDAIAAFGCEFTIMHGDLVENRLSKIGAALTMADALECARSAAKLAVDCAYETGGRLPWSRQHREVAGQAIVDAKSNKEIRDKGEPTHFGHQTRPRSAGVHHHGA
jgi:hypothetical protein